MIQGDTRGTCAICFREFLTDERGRLFRHVRKLGMPERCIGSKFPPAGTSLRGTEWALDRAASVVMALDLRRKRLDGQPDIEGVGPFSPMYPGLWHHAVMAIEHERAKVVAEVDELAARLAEWRPTAPFLMPRPIHRAALWKCRAGTAVPLCYSEAPRRPTGDPVLAPTMDGVDCAHCIVAAEQFSIITGPNP